MRPPTRALSLAAPLLIAALLTGCQPAPAPAPEIVTPVRVESPGLGVVFTDLPEGFRLVRNEGEELELEATSNRIEAPVTVAAGPRQSSSINLVEQAKTFQNEALAAGETFFGGNELVTPYGSAYAVRASADGGAAEERRILMLHPGDPDRLLTIAVRYPAGGGEVARARLQQLLELVANLEPMAPR